MKRKFIFLAMLLLTLIGGVKWNVLNAQETITIGNEEEAIRSYSVPFDLYNGYGVCQQLYTADEIGKTAGAIESLALKFVGPTGADMQTPANQDQVVVDFEIYVENTTMTTLSAFQVVETGDLYFSGKQPMESDAWTTFEFSNSFEYDGTNLLITIYCVGDIHEMKTDSNFYPFYIYTTNGVQCLSASPQDKPIAGASFNGLNENSGKNILQLTFAAGEGGEEPEPTPEPEQPETQEPVVVTIGDASANNTTANTNYPFANVYTYSHSQQIYTPATISAFCEQIPEGDITKIKYYIAETSQSYFGGVKVYMRNSLTSSFSSKTAWDKDFTAADLVFEGDVDVVDNAIEFVLKKSFKYDPTMNLIIYVDVDTKNGTSQTKFKTYSAAAKCALYYKNQSKNGGLDTDYLWGASSSSAANTINVVSLTFAGEGGGEEPTPEPTPVAPATPTNLSVASVGEMSVSLTWDAVETAASYNVYQGETLVATGVTATEYTVEGLTPETEYCFTVSAANGGGESAKSEQVCGTTTEFTGCYVNFTLTDSYGDGWNGNTLTVAYGGKPETIDFKGSGNSYKEKSLSMGIPSGAHVTITYNKIGNYPEENSFVVAYESGEEILNVAQGSLSATTSWEFDVDCTPKAPAAPVAKAEATGGSTIALTWNAVPTATSYNVYEGTEVVATVTETSYNFAELTPDTQYCYAVSAINEVGEGEVSETVCATTFEEGTIIVSVGEGGIESFSAPIYNIGSTVYSLSQQIYTSDEIGFNGGYANIQSISFHKVTGGNNVRNIVVYLQNVDKEMFAGNYDWIPFTDADIVYQGEFDFGVAGDWVTINFPTEFEYKGGNLAVTVYDKTGVGYGYDYAKCDKFTSSQIDNFRGMYVTKTAEMDFSQLSTYYGTTMKTTSYENPANVYYINRVKFRTTLIEADPIAPAPSNVVATVNGYSLITLTWDAVETANKYNVYAGTEKIATVTEPTFTYAGLEAETEYCFTVTTVNSGGESEASEEVCATTEEFNGCYVNFTLTDQPNDGWDGCSLVVEYDGLTESFNCPGGTSPKTYTIAISQGSTAKVTYKKGSKYPQEKGIIVTYESGKEILNIAQGSLSETTSWEFVVDCTPEAPGIATATANVTGDETIVLTMSAVGAESFNIYLGEELVATTTENVYTVEGLEPETEYCFTVEAVNEVGTSEELSEVACATTYKAGTAVVQIGEGTDNIVSTSPVHEFFANSISQTVYTAEEIGFGAGSIKSIAYNKYSGGNNDRNIAIYMKNVNVEDVDFTKDWEALTEDLCVYDNYYNFGTTGWVEIALQEAFDYTGGDLLVCVLDKTGFYANIQDNFYTYVTGSLRSIYYGYSQTIDPYNINLSKQSLYNNNYNTVSPQVKFVIEPYEIGKFIGKVIDEKNNTPIAGATLKFSGEKSYETTTKEDGTFDIDAVVGNYTLEISHPNYETKQLTNLEITNSGTITDLMEIELVAIATFVGGDSENPTAWNVAANWSTGEVPAAGADVIINANAVISSEVNVKSLTIKGTSYDTNLTIAANGTLTVTGAINQSNYQLVLEEGGQIFQNNEGVTARFRMNIDNPKEWSNTNTDGWQFISMPLLDVDYAAFASTWNQTTAQSTCDYDLYKYDGSQDNEWQNYRDGFTETTFKSGTGYLASRKEVETVTVSGTLNVANPFEYRTFSYVVEDEQVKELSRIHLVGNPFTYDIKWSDFNIIGNVYNIDTDEVEEKQLFVNGFAVANGGGYKYYDPNEENSDATIKVGQGFFVKILENGASLSYQPNTRSSKEKANSINVIASGKAGKDNVVVNFAGQAEGFNKLQNFNDAIATVYVTENGKNYGIANVDENTTEVALNFDAKEMGNYTISLDVNGEFETVTLVDRFTGVETNMLLEDEYTFTATSNDNVNRFVIRLANGQEPTANSQFVYQSGEELILSIEGSVQIVDMLGRVVYYNEHANGDNRINVAEFNNAAYVVRVVNEEGVKVQKVVIY